MNNKNKSFTKKLPQQFLQQAIIKQLRRKPGKSYSIGNLSTKLTGKNSKDSIKSALDQLYSKGKVYVDPHGKYFINPNYATSRSVKVTVLEGRADIISSGAAYIIVEGQEKDIYVPQKHINGALPGDIVKVELTTFANGRRPEGKITEVTKRNRSNFIGVFQDFKKYGYVYVETPKLSLEIRIKPEDYNGAEAGDAVVAEVTDFGTNKRQELLGAVTQVLDPENRNDFEMQSILINNGFEIDFSPEVIAESEKLSDEITAQDLAERRDYRNVLTFTIDPYNAKDFDDAISYQKLENGNTEIGVHIADVSHFVKPNTALDKEGFKRSTSVYLVDRVCPMLPERISNELCSLRPNEDKFCFSAIFQFDSNKQIRHEWFGKTLIHSDRRFTYEEAQEVIEGKSEELKDEILHINALGKDLNEKRFKSGSINFDTDEVRFELDENGTPIGIIKKVRQDAHKLIEEFMLLANKRVAHFINKKAQGHEIPFVYRVHDLPDPDRLMELALLASEFGIRLNMDTPKNITASLNSLSEGGDEENILQVLKPMAIRCMAKAAYSSDNVGHYGLGFEYYSHFTSPIRRYSDVLAHRILYQNLTGTKRVDKSALEEQCRYISLKEREAISAERESIKYKQVEYLSSMIGQEMQGVVRSFIDKGIFVELVDSQSDGFIPFNTIQDNLVLHPAKIKVTGYRSGLSLRIGDKITVRIKSTDLDKRQVEFELVMEKKE